MKWTQDDIGDQRGRTVLITGANSGIGLETARALAGRGAHVVMACRSLERADAARARLLGELPDASLEVRRLDLGDLASVREFSASFVEDHPRLDVLINNAGVMVPPYGRTADGFELQIGTNHFGHFALTGHLMPRLRATDGARVVVVASSAHRWGRMRFDDLNWERRRYVAWLAYGQSKLANLLFARELTRRAADAVLVASAHPGYTSTGLLRTSMFQAANPFFGQPAWQGALPSLYAACARDVEADDYIGPRGLFEMRGYPARVGRAAKARDDRAARALWEVSVEVTGVDPAA